MGIAMMEELITTVEAILKTLECPICLELLKAPVSAGCGHFFCRQCVSGILLSTYRAPCPLCKRSFTRRSVHEATQRQSIISASKILADTCGSLTGINFNTQVPIHSTESDVHVAIPSKKLKLSNKKTENVSTRKRKSFENKDGENLKDESVSDLEMKDCTNVADNSSLSKRACHGSEDESDLPTLAEVFQLLQKSGPAPEINDVIAEQCSPIELSDGPRALKKNSAHKKAQNTNHCKPFDSVVGDSKSKVVKISSVENYQEDIILSKNTDKSEIECNSPLQKSKCNVPLNDKKNSLKDKRNEVHSDQCMKQDKDSNSKQTPLKEKEKAEIELEDKSKENKLCHSPIGESRAVFSLNSKQSYGKKLNKPKKKNNTKPQNSNTKGTFNVLITNDAHLKEGETSPVLAAKKCDKKAAHASNEDATNLPKPCAQIIVEDPFKAMGLTDTAVSVGCVASPLATKIPSVQKSPGWSRVKEVKKDFKMKKFTLLHVEKNSPSVSVKNCAISEHETTSTNTAKSDTSLDPHSEDKVENKSLDVFDIEVHKVRNYKETEKMMDSNSPVSKEASEDAAVHCKDDTRSSKLSNVDESNLYGEEIQVPEKMDCSTTTTDEYNNTTDTPNTTMLKTNLDLAESRIIIKNVPCVSITPNSLICAKYPDTMVKIPNQSIVETPKIICEFQDTFLMKKNGAGSSHENIFPGLDRRDKIQKFPSENKHVLFTNTSEMKQGFLPLTTAHISKNQIFQSHLVVDDDDDNFQYVEQSQQTSQVFDFHKSACDNLKTVVVQQPPPYIYCPNTEKTKVVKRTCLTLEEIQDCFLKSSQCNSSENICSLPFLSGLFKLHIGVSDETLNVSVLRVVDPVYEDNGAAQNNVSLLDKCIQAPNNLSVSSVVVPSSNTESEASQPDTVDPFPYLSKNSLNQKDFKHSALVESNHMERNADVYDQTAFSVPESNDGENTLVKNSSFENQEILTNEKDVDMLEITNFPRDKDSKDILNDPEPLLPETNNAASVECNFPTSEKNCGNGVFYEPSTVTEIVNLELDDPLNSEEEESFKKLQQCVQKERSVVHERKQSRLSLKQKSTSSRIQPPELSDESVLESSESDKRLPKEVKNQTSMSLSPTVLHPPADLYSPTINNTEKLSKVTGEMPCTLNSMLSEEASQMNASEIIAEIADLSDKIRSLEEKLQDCGSAELNKTAPGSGELNKSVTLPDSESEDSVDIFPPTPSPPPKQI